MHVSPTRRSSRSSSRRAAASTMKVIDEEDEAKRDQRRGVEIAHRLGEFVGDGRGDRGRRARGSTIDT